MSKLNFDQGRIGIKRPIQGLNNNIELVMKTTNHVRIREIVSSFPLFLVKYNLTLTRREHLFNSSKI